MQCEVVEGLSPRVRGNRIVSIREGLGEWSIPAGAGEPIRAARRREYAAVYPRGCGGTDPGLLHLPACEGLSPRVRGNPQPQPASIPNHGSIPAGAGEPVTAIP